MRESNKIAPVSYPYRKSITNLDFPDAIFIFGGNQTYRPLPGYLNQGHSQGLEALFQFAKKSNQQHLWRCNKNMLKR